MFLTNKIAVRKSNVLASGKYEELGVFATEDIKKGEVVEIAPIIVLQFEELIDTNWNTLFDYYFWMDDYVVLALGYGSIYNHSDTPNIKYKMDAKSRKVTFTAIADIKKKEELCFNYRGFDKSKAPLWFQSERYGR